MTARTITIRNVISEDGTIGDLKMTVLNADFTPHQFPRERVNPTEYVMVDGTIRTFLDAHEEHCFLQDHERVDGMDKTGLHGFFWKNIWSTK